MVETPNDLSAAGGGAFDALVRLAWRCGTFATGVATLAIGALWYKVSSYCNFLLQAGGRVHRARLVLMSSC